MKSKTNTWISLVLLAALAVAVLSQNANVTRAQSDVAVVIVMPTLGGTTNPVAGEYSYANGTNIIIQAIPDSGYVFSHWLISGDLFPGHTASQAIPSQIINPDTGEPEVFPRVPTNLAIDALTFTANPANITCGYGYTYTYTAMFAAVNATNPNPTPAPTEAVVIVMPTIGGSVSPEAGTHNYPNGTAIVLQATPNTGYQFSYWLVSGEILPGHTTGVAAEIVDPITGDITVVPKPATETSTSGIDSLTFTANPTHITCGYGYTYTYTAVFTKIVAATPTAAPTATITTQPTATPTPAPTPSPTPTSGTDMTTLIIVVVVIVVIIVVVLAAVMLRRKK